MGLPCVTQQQLEVGVGKCGGVAGAPGARVAQEDLAGGAAEPGLQRGGFGGAPVGGVAQQGAHTHYYKQLVAQYR